MISTWEKNPVPYNVPFIGKHFIDVLEETIKFSGIKAGETILDFGCGTQELKKYLPKGVKYIGYDIVKEHSDVKNYKKVKADKILCIGVLEHIELLKLTEILKSFKKMDAKELIVFLPSGNLLNRFLAFVTGLDAEHFFMHEPSKIIVRTLVKELGLPTKYKRFRFIQYLGVFKLKGD